MITVGGEQQGIIGLTQFQPQAPVSEVLQAKKKELQEYNSKVAELSAQTEALQKKKDEIESAITALSGSGVNEIGKVSSKAVDSLKAVSASGVGEITKAGEKALATLKSLSAGQVQEMIKVSNHAIGAIGAVLDEMKTEIHDLIRTRLIATGHA